MKYMKFKLLAIVSVCMFVGMSEANATIMSHLFMSSMKSINNSENNGSGINQGKANSPEQCAEHLKYGQPSMEGKTNIRICRDGYALIYNTQIKNPVWVAEHIKKENIFGKGERKTHFYPDPLLPKGSQAKASDFSSKTIDQGHMAPAADFSNSQQLMDESFYFSNIVPQDSNNNRGIWANLEKKVRVWAKSRDDLYVVTGPIFKDMKINSTVGDNVAMPDYLFKVVYDAQTGGSIAFIIPNSPQPEDAMADFIYPVKEVEKMTGLVFFSKLSEADQIKTKSKKSGMWTR